MLVTVIEGFREISLQWSDRILAYQLENITFLNSLPIPEDSISLELQLVLKPMYDSDSSNLSPHHFEVFGYSKTDWSRLCDGTIRALYDDDEQRLQSKNLGLDQLFTEKHTHPWKAFDVSQFYDAIKPQGYNLGPDFQKLSEGRLDGTGNGLTSLGLTSRDKFFTKHGLSQFLIHPTDLDAIIQTSVFVHSNGGRRRNVELLIPTKIKSISLSSGLLQSQEQSALKIATTTMSVSIREADFAMAATDDTDQIRVVVNSFRQAFLSRAQELSAPDAVPLKSCYYLDWRRDIALMSDVEIFDECSKAIKEDTENSIRATRQQEIVCLYFMNLASETIPRTRRIEMPSHLQKYMQWIDLQLASEPVKALLKHPDQAILAGTQEQRTSYLDSFVQSCGPGRLIVETGNNLLSILTGESDALDLLFSTDLVSDFYSGTAFSAIFERLASCIRLLAYRNPSMKILEIGAGTGGATAKILHELGQQDSSGNSSQHPAAFDSYTYTDVSPAFFEQAKQKFNGYSSKMIYSVLDMEKDVTEQDFATGTYDLIICSLVLHVAADLRKTMQNIRKLLRSGGKMLILENLTPKQCQTSFTFGLLPGWWYSTDENRKFCPLLDAQGWEEVFQSSGYSPIQTILPDYTHPEAMSFVVLLSTAIDPHATSASENIDIVVKPTIGGQELIAHEIGSALSSENYRTNAITISDWIENGASSKICVFLLEVGYAFWNNLNEDEWSAFKKSLTYVETIVWVTQATSKVDQEPFMGLVTGISRAVRSQMPHIRFYELKLSPNTTSKQAVPHLLSVLRSYAFVSSTNEDAEFVEINGALCIGRLREAAVLNEKIMCDKGLATPTICKLEDGLARPLSLTINSPGQLDTLMLVDDPDFDTPLRPTEVIIKVMATGINFKDILWSMGQAGGFRLGFEFSGLVSEAGVESGFVKGNQVCGLTLNGAYKTWVRTDASMLMRMPSDFSFAAAAAIPLAYTTAYYSLINLANLQPGESVLIHSGSGGVGQAAINIAKRLNARIFVTVGSSEKKELIKRLFGIPEDHIFSSRNTDFARAIRAMTDCGVDVVLNSLKRELQTASWTCIAPLGRFIEIGKSDIEDWRRALPMTPFANNVSFSSVDLSIVMQKSKGTVKRILDNVAKFFKDEGELLLQQPPQSYRISQIGEAFRHMQSGDSSGKLVVEWHPEDQVLVRLLC